MLLDREVVAEACELALFRSTSIFAETEGNSFSKRVGTRETESGEGV